MKKLLFLFFVGLGINQLFANGNTELVNTQTIDMSSVKTLNVSYSSDDIVLLESNDNNLVLKEYMSKTGREYFAKVENSQGAVNIHNGKRPWGVLFFTSRIEIYVPKTFTGNFSLNLVSGNLTANYDMTGASVKITVRSGDINAKTVSAENILLGVISGKINIGELTGKNISVSSGSGDITINNCEGKIDFDNTSGSIAINNFDGNGTLNVGSGRINLVLNRLAGDLNLSAVSGNMDLTLGENASFVLDAENTSGTIRAPGLQGALKKVQNFNIGSTPVYKVAAKIGSGDMDIYQ